SHTRADVESSAWAVEQWLGWLKPPSTPTTSPGPLRRRMTSQPLWPNCVTLTQPLIRSNTWRTGSPSRKIVCRRENCRSWALETIVVQSGAEMSAKRDERWAMLTLVLETTDVFNPFTRCSKGLSSG